MNKRQLKKKVKQAKLNKERGLILSLEDQHFIRNYGKRYYTEKELAYGKTRVQMAKATEIDS